MHGQLCWEVPWPCQDAEEALATGIEEEALAAASPTPRHSSEISNLGLDMELTRGLV